MKTCSLQVYRPHSQSVHTVLYLESVHVSSFEGKPFKSSAKHAIYINLHYINPNPSAAKSFQGARSEKRGPGHSEKILQIYGSDRQYTNLYYIMISRQSTLAASRFHFGGRQQERLINTMMACRFQLAKAVGDANQVGDARKNTRVRFRDQI